MAEEVEKLDVSSLAGDLEAALAALNAALADADRSAATIRRNISQVGVLAKMVREMEAAMALARQNLSIRLASTSQATTSQTQRPTTPEDARAERPEPEARATQPVTTISQPDPGQAPTSPSEPEAGASEALAQPPQPETEISEQVTPPPSPQQIGAEPVAIPSKPETIRPISHRLRMSIVSKAGSLDLKAVDGAVNENPAVVDVALLDYDGRHATLKLWVSGGADPDGVQESLLASLRRRLGDEGDVEVRMDFEEAAAA
jgi:hypothetical protein